MEKKDTSRKQVTSSLLFLALAIGLTLTGKMLANIHLARKAQPPKYRTKRQEQSGTLRQKQRLPAKKNRLNARVRPDFKIKYKLKGFGAGHEKKMREALAQLAWVVKSEAFKNKVLNHTYKGKKTFYENKGLSNLEIYQSILKAAEALNPIEDGVMELNLTLYHSTTNTVGYTYPDTNEIWVNKKYFERYTLGEVANNAMHEWLHKIGYEHSYYNNAERPYTVPYAIGEIVEQIFNELNQRV